MLAKKSFIVLFLALALAVQGYAQKDTTSTSPKKPDAAPKKTMEKMSDQRDGRQSSEFIKSWPAKPQEAAQLMIKKYGRPDEATPSMLIWYHQGSHGKMSGSDRSSRSDTARSQNMRNGAGSSPWKYTIVYREEVQHNFPKPHTDFLEQAIDYRVPPDKFDELAQYDGSVIAERTKGELAARCDKEELNFLALNLANDVCTGKLSPDEARKQYAEIAAAFMKKEPRPYTQGLRFDAKGTNGGAADPDKAADMPANQ
jgi:hypothetical protein